MVVVVIIEQHMAYAKTQYQYVKLSTGAMVAVLYGGHGQGRQITPYDFGLPSISPPAIFPPGGNMS